jgi:hypothetical protein
MSSLGADTVAMPAGETLFVPERMIVAPIRGVFHGLHGHGTGPGDSVVSRGDGIGALRSLGRQRPSAARSTGCSWPSSPARMNGSAPANPWPG